MQWKELFTKSVLDRGRRYHKSGRVQLVDEENLHYRAAVEGSERYEVWIDLKHKPVGMDCNCPHAYSGNKCKHMAAVLFAIEELEGKGFVSKMQESRELVSILENKLSEQGYLEDLAGVFPEEFWEEGYLSEEYGMPDPDDPWQSPPGIDHYLMELAKSYRDQEAASAGKPKKDKSKKSSNRADKTRVYPFRKGGKSKEYRYFDLEQATSWLAFTKGTYDKAVAMIEQRLIGLEIFTLGQLNRIYADETRGSSARAVARVAGDSTVQVLMKRNQVLELSCRVTGCDIRSYEYYYRDKPHEVCEHEAALLLLVQDYIERENPGDSTDGNGGLLLEYFRGQTLGETLSEETKAGNPISLTARIEADREDNLQLSFKIGQKKSYVLKDMRKLMQAVKRKEILELSEKERIDFLDSSFDEESKAYYELICRHIDYETNRVARSKYLELEADFPKKQIGLYGQMLDDFFEVAKGTQVEFIRSEEKFDRDDPSGSKWKTTRTRGTISLKDEDPKVSFLLEVDRDDEGVLHGLAVKGNLPTFLKGAKHLYCLDGENLRRISDELRQNISFFTDLEQENKEGVLFRVGRRKLTEFYHTVLPWLEERFEVEEAELTEVWELVGEAAEVSFYLDADAGDITCIPKVTYGDKEHLLTECISSIGFAPPKEEYRNSFVEEQALSVLYRYFPSFDSARVLHCGKSEEQVFSFLQSGIRELMELGQVHTTDSFRNLRTIRRAKVRVSVTVESDLMNLEILSSDISPKDLLGILESYRQKKKYHRLKNGDFVSLEDGALEELALMVDAMHLSAKDLAQKKISVPLYRALYLDKILEEHQELYVNRDSHFKQLVRDFKTVMDSDYEVPKELESTLRNYQKFGYRWLRTLTENNFGGILADDMGLGKTLQMITVLLAYKSENNEAGTSIVVTPASLVYNWKEEFNKFAPQLKVEVVAGTQKERWQQINDYQDLDVLITSYDLLKRDILLYEGKIFDYQIIDEAQYIKNPQTAVAKAVKAVGSKKRVAMTGTPIENRLAELWSIFDFLMPGYLYSYQAFRQEFELAITKEKDEEVSKRLKAMVAPFILRRLKQEVLRDLPDKIEEIHYATMEKEQQLVYDSQVVRMGKILSEADEASFGKSKIQVLAELTRIREICCDPGLLLEDYQGGSAKRELCLELVRSAVAAEHKLLIFSQFTSMLELLEQDLTKEKISYFKITGETKKKKRLELANQFNHDSTPVFLISLKAGGVGLNLTGADLVIHYDPWWNLAAQNQATDRAHRIGQTKVVSVYKLIAKGTIEEKIVKLQADKKELADAILEGNSGGLVNMTRQDLLELLQG